jgi:hypothetical protein
VKAPLTVRPHIHDRDLPCSTSRLSGARLESEGDTERICEQREET